MVMQEGKNYVLENPARDERLTVSKEDIEILAQHVMQRDI